MRHWLFLVWLCFLGRGIFYATVLPLWEGYDEYAHFAYVQYLALYAELPTSGMRISREVEQSLRIVPVPWMLRQSCSPPCLVHDDYWKLSDVERAERRRQLRVLDPDPSGATEKLFLYEAQQPPLYYWLLSWPLGAAGSWSLAGRVLLLRWLSVAIASLVIPLGFLLAREVFRHETSALGVVALVAAMPEFLLDISRIGNESLAVVLFTLLVYGSLRDTWWQGLALGFGLLTKAYFLAAAPALLLVSLRRRKPHGALAVAFGAAVAGWWYWRNRVLTGSWAGLQVTAAARELSLADNTPAGGPGGLA
ncbi:MAG: hypothetical protein HY238_28255 [Acidobacteria bacterium]|nr:hypothetical protein [Acidobacteriota bacterium]